ncbi:MAG: glutamine--tRNA ligase/YqeY domain fusion protein [Magnetococcales bacterium]|nr:glutamine--tRNA ligase/YqeY domain fusion protein [Magnetococcales bacterium]
MAKPEEAKPIDFIRAIVAEDLRSGKHAQVVTRFPPEPNGYLHIGHAKSICLNFGVAQENPGGKCNLRFDDTNPTREEPEYIRSIEEDVRWLGFEFGERRYFASDYFPQIYAYAEALIMAGKAYVCSLSAEQIRVYRGTLTEPGQDSPYRNRSVEENLDLFRRMRAGEFPDGAHVLRARIDMASPNINMRDPILYRIIHASHHQTSDQWCIYPMYDYTHCLSDALEGITHSLCTLEFEDHRPLYDWVLDQLSTPCHPRQIEFSRLSLEYTVMSKRLLNELVVSKVVSGWDDPRMPTISGLRRRGYTPESIREFCHRIGITKAPNKVEMSLLENCLRDDLEESVPRAMAVLDPIRVIIDNYPDGQEEMLTVPCHPNHPDMGTRTLGFSRDIYIERDDFREIAPPKFKRLALHGEVRLRHAYVIRCHQVTKDPDTGVVVALHCTLDPTTLNANPEGRKVKGVIHWVSVRHCVRHEIRLYDRLFSKPNPGEDREEKDFRDSLNPDSLHTLPTCPMENSLDLATPGSRFQLERLGYFCVDTKNSTPGKPVFNRTVTLRDSWAKIEAKQ